MNSITTPITPTLPSSLLISSTLPYYFPTLSSIPTTLLSSFSSTLSLLLSTHLPSSPSHDETTCDTLLWCWEESVNSHKYTISPYTHDLYSITHVQDFFLDICNF